MAQSTVTPRLAKSFRMATMFTAAAESKPLVGSSQSRSCGRPPMTARPMLKRRRSPPESPLRPIFSSPMGVEAQASSLSRERTQSTRLARSFALNFVEKRSSAAKSSISRAVKALRYTSSCGTTLAARRITSVLTGLPLYSALPSTRAPGAERPRNSVSNEVLPEPLAPMTAESSPGGKAPVTPESTVRGAAPPFLDSPGSV
mmetsp:Transcript_32846/g.90720  ORF Transcript_32846/g.90720 Transcript_32846/m.90720 type:complete len:202 (-) Transcript_32846:111-716(-)